MTTQDVPIVGNKNKGVFQVLEKSGANFPTIGKPEKLPKGWRWVKLGEVCEILSGTTPKSGESQYWNGDITWITPTDLGKLTNKYVRDSERRISKAGFESCNLSMVPVGSVILSSRAPIGHLGIASVSLCVNQGCKVFIPGGEIESEFLYHALKRSVWQLQQLGSGATFAEVSKTQLSNFRIPLPPLSEQHRISAILNEQIAAVERARKAAFERLEAVKALPSALLRTVFPEHGQTVPKGWQWVRLGEIAKTCSGTTPSRSRSDYYQGTIPWVKTAELKDGSIKATEEHVSELAMKETSLPLLPPGTLLIAMYGQGQTRGRTGLLKCRATTNQACFAIIPNPSVFESEFLQMWFIFSYGWIREQSESRGGNQPNLNGEILKSLSLPLPPLSEQHRIAAILNEQMAAVERARQAAEDELATINALPAALLRRAFRGEL